jgi:DNA-binding XRE family transcriptional regulator
MLLCNTTTRYDENCGYEHPCNKTWQVYKAHTGAKKMSQGDICRKLGFDRSCISNIEAGKGNPTLAKIENIAQTLNVSIEKLLK